MLIMYLRFPGGKPKAVTFSYDDGCPQDVRLANTLDRYNMKGTFNLCRFENRKPTDRIISLEDAKEHILNKGHEIATHGYYHLASGAVHDFTGIQDVINCRLHLEKEFGVIVRGMAYATSGIKHFHNFTNYEKVKNYLTYLGIAYARSTADNNSFYLPTDWHKWETTGHHNNPRLMEYIDEFLAIDSEKSMTGVNRMPRLFFVWGHSREFDKDNNWDRLEEICQKLSNKDNIWYATNIEIYDYVKAYESLVMSADRKIIYNPSNQTVWFDIDGTLYSVAPGETLKR